MIREPGALARIRAALERQGLRLLLGTRFIRDRPAASRSAPVDGRTLDPEVAAILQLADLMHRSDLAAFDPVTGRRTLLQMKLTDALILLASTGEKKNRRKRG